MIRNVLLAGILLGAGSVAQAKHLGTVGRTYELVEPDFRAVIAQQMARAITPEMVAKKREGAVDRYIEKLPKYAFSTRTKPVVREVSVKQTLARDVWAPELDANGKIVHKLLAKKGEVVDPLASGIIPTSTFLIIDGTNPKHVEFARQVHSWTPLTYIVLSNGDPRKLAADIDYPVDYLTPQLLELFKITSVPSFVWAEKRGTSGVVQVFEMAEPLVLADVQAKWKPAVTGSAGLKQLKENKDAITQQGIGNTLGTRREPVRD